MNKKAIFIPVLLLALQPNNILGAAGQPNKTLDADDRFNRAKTALESYLAHHLGCPEFKKGAYVSDHPKVNLLLGIMNENLNETAAWWRCDELNGDTAPYHPGAIEIINTHYPDVPLHLENLSGANIKGSEE